MIRRPLAAAMLVAAVAAAPARGQPPPISKTELRAESSPLADRRLEALFWSMLRHDDFRTREPPQAVLRKLWFHTAPVMTSVPQLCRYDNVVLEFAPTAPGPADADTPTRPVGVSVDHLYRFLEPPPLDGGRREAVRVHTGGRCAGLDTKNDPAFFSAADEQVALNGTIAWLKLRRALQAKAAVPLKCDLFAVDTQPCPEIILALPADQPDMISACTADGDTDCFEIMTEDRQIRILVDRSAAGAGAIRSASLESMIIFADTLID
jgi:hypothetical protein